jgi:1-acyl-sn-glycerol-3-phosphate acyltransferase
MWAPGILWFCGVKLVVSGLEHIASGEAFIFVSNHLSFLDIPVLFKVIPVNLHFVAKSEIKRMPFVGWYMWATGMIFIDRQNRERAIQSLKKAGRLIKKGKNVIMFPEGTRSRDGSVQEFKKGPFVLAAEAELRIIPVAISGPEKIVPPGTLKLKPGIVHVHLGEARVKSHSTSLKDFMDLTREDMIRLKHD